VVYWLGAAVWEWANHAMVCFATWIMFFAFDMTSMVGTGDKVGRCKMNVCEAVLKPSGSSA